MPDVILLVEDDPAVSASVRRRLLFEGFAVETAASGPEALTKVECCAPSLMILDVMLPGLDGFQVAERLRRNSDLPILMLTARDSLEDRVTGLERGADDYLVKPFELPELLARIRALLRRSRPSTQAATGQKPLSFGGLSLHPLTREVQRQGEPLRLTPREFSLLEFFIKHPRQVLTREQIFENVWGYDHEGSSNVIDVYVRQLREKTEAGGLPRLLHTVRGVGYALRDS